jgi:sugar/nucleoside kinase (ribokinase family)
MTAGTLARTPMELVIVGHLGPHTDSTPAGVQTSLGGSGYGVAMGATVGTPGTIGLVAQVGHDLDLPSHRLQGIDLEGVRVYQGASARFRIRQLPNDKRHFRSDLGVADPVDVGSFPDAYVDAAWIHLGTAPPVHQLLWLEHLRQRSPRSLISVEMFEHFVERERKAARRVCDLADFIFMTAEEHAGLYDEGMPAVPAIIKHGAMGADLCFPGEAPHHVAAVPVHPVDTTGAGQVFCGVFLALAARGIARSIRDQSRRRRWRWLPRPSSPLEHIGQGGLAAVPALQFAVWAGTAAVKDFGVDHSHVTRALAEIRARTRPEVQRGLR